MASILAKLKPVAKAVAAAVAGAVLPFLSVGIISGFDWKAILSAAVGAAVLALTVWVTPNHQVKAKAKAGRRG